MPAIDGNVPGTAKEITTGQANRVWHVDAAVPYVLKHYGDAGRSANEAAALTVLGVHQAPAPRLLATGRHADTAWTAHAALHADPIPADRFLDEVAAPLEVVHRIPGTHFGRLAGAQRHLTWAAYLRDRRAAYTAAAPDLASVAAAVVREIDSLDVAVEPRLLELAVFGDQLSDLSRLAVRLRMPEPTDTLVLARRPGPGRCTGASWPAARSGSTSYGPSPLW